MKVKIIEANGFQKKRIDSILDMELLEKILRENPQPPITIDPDKYKTIWTGTSTGSTTDVTYTNPFSSDGTSITTDYAKIFLYPTS